MEARLQIPSKEVAWIFDGTTVKAGPQKGPSERVKLKELNENWVFRQGTHTNQATGYSDQRKRMCTSCTYQEIGHNLYRAIWFGSLGILSKVTSKGVS